MTPLLPPTVRDRAGLPADRLAAVAGELRALGTLEDVLAWAGQARPPRPVVEIVTQDEFTHDVVVPLRPPLWLAFDVT